MIRVTVFDLPAPVEPTTAICLLKNLFPSTGTLISGSASNAENSSFLCSGTESSKIFLMSFSVAGSTPVGGIVRASPPRMNFSSLITPSGKASMTCRRSDLWSTSIRKLSMMAMRTQSSWSVTLR
ncbi:hypothetical protein D3C75_566570 [compost metagenome]